MRVSEFCGLTKKDLDFKNLRIRVDHQLVRERGGTYSDAGVALNVYTHASYAHAAEQMAQIAQFRQRSETEKSGDLTAV